MDLWLYFLPLSRVKFGQAALEPTKATPTSVTAADTRRCDHGHRPSQGRQDSCIFWEEGHREPDLIPEVIPLLVRRESLPWDLLQESGGQVFTGQLRRGFTRLTILIWEAQFLCML